MFSQCNKVIDRFHVQKLAMEALQELSIRHRWEAVEQENSMLTEAKKIKRTSKLKFLEIATPEGSSWQEADMYFIKPEKNRLHLQNRELKSCSQSMLV